MIGILQLSNAPLSTHHLRARAKQLDAQSLGVNGHSGSSQIGILGSVGSPCALRVFAVCSPCVRRYATPKAGSRMAVARDHQPIMDGHEAWHRRHSLRRRGTRVWEIVAAHSEREAAEEARAEAVTAFKRQPLLAWPAMTREAAALPSRPPKLATCDQCPAVAGALLWWSGAHVWSHHSVDSGLRTRCRVAADCGALGCWGSARFAGHVRAFWRPSISES